MFLTDLTFIEEGGSDYTNYRLIRFKKYRFVAQVIEMIKQYQLLGYSFPVNDSLYGLFFILFYILRTLD